MLGIALIFAHPGVLAVAGAGVVAILLGHARPLPGAPVWTGGAP